MPRDGSGIYTRPPGTNGVPDTTIESSKYNGFVADIETDANTPRPIVAGGTGATSAAQARANLGVTSGAAQVTNYDSHVFETGSFWSSPTATAAPVASNISGTAVVLNADPNYITLDALDNATGLFWTRRKTGGVWSAWVKQDASDKVAKAGDTMTGPLTVQGDITLWRPGSPNTGALFFTNGGAGGKYCYYNGTAFQFEGGPITVSAVNGALNGNATTASNAANAYACSGNAATANYAANSGACSGNAATATTAASCSGNAASANYATTAGNIAGGGSVTVGDSGAIEGPWYIDMKAPGHAGHDYCARLMVNGDHTFDITTSKLYSSGVIESAMGYKTGPGGNGGWETFSFRVDPPAGGFLLYITGSLVGPVSVSISDYRIKKKVAPLDSMWDRVKALKPIAYMHKQPDNMAPNALIVDDGVERWGFAAHELQKTLTKSAASGAKDGEHLQSPEPWTVIAALTKSLQEAMGRIEALEAAR
jgi:hypothetical protein